MYICIGFQGSFTVATLTLWGFVPKRTILEETAIGGQNTHERDDDQDHQQRHPRQNQQLVPHVQGYQLFRHTVLLWI